MIKLIKNIFRLKKIRYKCLKCDMYFDTGETMFYYNGPIGNSRLYHNICLPNINCVIRSAIAD